MGTGKGTLGTNWWSKRLLEVATRSTCPILIHRTRGEKLYYPPPPQRHPLRSKTPILLSIPAQPMLTGIAIKTEHSSYQQWLFPEQFNASDEPEESDHGCIDNEMRGRIEVDEDPLR